MRRRSLAKDLDWATVFLYLALAAIGFFTIFAATQDGTGIDLFSFRSNYSKQFIWIGISLFVAALVIIVDSKFYTTFAFFFYALVILMLVSVLLLGETVSGSKSWFEFGGIKIQPAEFAKFATNLAVAKYLSRSSADLRKMVPKLIAFALIGLPGALIILQGDTGSALVFAAFVLVFFREGMPSYYLIIGFTVMILSVLALLLNKFILLLLLALLAGLLIYLNKKERQAITLTLGLFVICSGYIFSVDYVFNNVLKAHQKERINVLLGKEHDPRGAAYNVNQSLIAIGSGGLTGKGYLQGTQTHFDFVPEQSTDFIFCTIGEEHGFVGTFLLISLFLALLFRIIYLAERQRSAFSRIYGYGVACILFLHITINVGMTIGLVPVIGIPFPFVSYGGSSILSFTILLFILLRLDAERLSILR